MRTTLVIAALAARDLDDESVLTQSTIFLPANDIFTDQAGEPASAFPAPPTRSTLPDATLLAMRPRPCHPQRPAASPVPSTSRRARDGVFRPAVRVLMVVTDDVRTLELLGYMGGPGSPTGLCEWWVRRAICAELPAVVRPGGLVAPS
jgi:hypothetical protein